MALVPYFKYSIIKIRRNTEALLGTLSNGELGYTTDTNNLYIGSITGNVLITGASGSAGDWETLLNRPDSLVALGELADSEGYLYNDGEGNLVYATPSGSIPNHNDLSNIQGGDTGEYYHLTSAEHTIAVASASVSADGYLKKEDWDDFNSKQDALGFTPVPDTRLIDTTSPLEGGGTLDGDLTLSIPSASVDSSGYLKSIDFNTFNDKEEALTFDSPLSRDVNEVSLPSASVSADGYLLKEDWDTFNSKEDALGNPSEDGFILSSTIGGVRSWVAQASGSMLITASGSSDCSVSGITIQLTAGDTFAFGDVGVIDASENVQFAKADAIANCGMPVMCAEASIASGSIGTWLVIGVARNDAWSWTIGTNNFIFLSTQGTTGNTLTQSSPSGTDNCIQILATTLAATRILFSPQSVIVEHN